MNVGISIFSGIPIEEQIKHLKDNGINRTFISSEWKDFDGVMSLMRENGIVCETLHAPYNRINDMWGRDPFAARKMLRRLRDAVDKCAKYSIPIVIVHLSSGCPMPEINRRGIRRFDSLYRYAKKRGVTIAYENQRYLENITFFMERHRDAAFCYDVGHENGFTKNIMFMDHFGSRLVALHVHDNRCGGYDTDDHLIPFDGKIDYAYAAKAIADSPFDGTMMLEITKRASIDDVRVYGDITDEEYYTKAASAARRLADMVEEYSK